VFLYLPASHLLDDMLGQPSGVLETGDIIADGGNSYWGDSIRRHARLQASGVRLSMWGRPAAPAWGVGRLCLLAGSLTAAWRTKLARSRLPRRRNIGKRNAFG